VLSRKAIERMEFSLCETSATAMQHQDDRDRACDCSRRIVTISSSCLVSLVFEVAGMLKAVERLPPMRFFCEGSVPTADTKPSGDN
jgi:hypothetical protein